MAEPARAHVGVDVDGMRVCSTGADTPLRKKWLETFPIAATNR
jgi:hypothetical protein